ncbi:receptor-interacting serine/threonine-protein kinase 1 [Denticeps clupeoides]|uniref:Receptor-interacting serine/threonine-protein kinase 1 n=1 Tax=Denticeps clupeoides TaxID=299321 RepID=A0AAY4AYW7_9TELE|nr:receptor-interacting serine/threonine-protein kinase 1 [Denticeps clupeoides]
MATTQNLEINMRSSDLIKRERIDIGGFGEVFICYHKTLGQVVLKTVYTGPPRNDGQRQSLLEEGNLMRRLNHKRVVKLLGVILEDGDYSLVMELIPKGNLYTMLERVHVPVSIKGRIILEILEGMIYLNENGIIHKDLKPENILVDKEFHIKIADLGLATCQSWSRLTKEESRRQSQLGLSNNVRMAGTLCYMAPEHLESINHRSTEKSDVYSFAIVLWVILTGREPYENAMNETHICQCVRQGDRPDEREIPGSIPQEMIRLMKQCWEQDPERRPTFKESYNTFLPFYHENLEKNVKSDSNQLKYEGPEELVEKMKSISLDKGNNSSGSQTSDSPTPLRSSEPPIEASIDDLQMISFLQSDAAPMASGARLEQKLAQELNYHKHGSYSPSEAPETSQNPSRLRHLHTQSSQSGLPLQQTVPSLKWPGDLSSVQSWCAPENSSIDDNSGLQSEIGLPESFLAQIPGVPPLNRMHSWPALPEAAVHDAVGSHWFSSGLAPQQDSGGLYIHNASGIQIGHNNTLSIGTNGSSSTASLSSSSNRKFKELLQKYDSYSVTEKHLDLLRDNITSNWKRCARRLGLTNAEVDTIEHDYARDGLNEKVHQMLERWRMKEGFVGSTVGSLCNRLYNHIQTDLLYRLLLICEESENSQEH